MSAEVVAIHGAVASGEPNPGLIKHLEELMAEAQSGRLRAIAYATVLERPGDGHAICHGHYHEGETRWALSAAIMRLHDTFAGELRS